MITAPLLALFVAACARPDPMAEALRPDSGARSVVWVFTKRGDAPWERSAAPLAYNVGSLGLGTVEGLLTLVGLPMADQPTWWDERFPALRVRGWQASAGVALEALADPASWSPVSWTLTDPEAISALDPQPFEGGFWYYAARGAAGDPAAAPGPHAIRSSPPPQARLNAHGLADPSPVRFQGKTFLFATEWPDAVVIAQGDPLFVLQRFPGLSVPFGAVVSSDGQESLWMAAQAVVAGRRQPVLSVSGDGQAWSDPQPIFVNGAPATDSLESCTSPVLAQLGEGALALFCVEERSP